MSRYLVELKHTNMSADYILSELHLEFGRSPEPTSDPDILKLRVDQGALAVLCDYDHNRVWITLETDTPEHHDALEARIISLLQNPRHAGKLDWEEVQL